jgi:ATP-binding cassette, subfamily G (WHITE), member 1
LKNLNGEFKARELSVILGPSGSGKSTLLNLLSGYKSNSNVSGMVKVNGSPTDPKLFRHTSSYVMQDSLLHPLLSVKEAMSFSSNLKIGKEMSADEKQQRVSLGSCHAVECKSIKISSSFSQISEILEILGLTETLETFTGKLSGGQQKRLSIALELVDNPRVIFFDEPTSGLDSSASTHCLSLLKRLAESGRTIICKFLKIVLDCLLQLFIFKLGTVHQPSALLFQMFDNIYAIAEGQCIYQGSSENLVPFLAEFDLVCPDTFNPCDYLLEISTHDYGYQIGNLNQKIRDGLNLDYRKSRVMNEKPCDQHQFVQQSRHETNPLSICVKKAKFSSKLQIFDPKSYCNDSDLYSTSFLRQFYYLLIRTFLLITRNPSMCLMRIFIHLSVAIVIGCIYQGVGDSAKNQMNNFRYIFYTVMFLMFTAFSSLQTTCKNSLN